MPEEMDKPGVDNAQLEDCDRVSEFERMLYRFNFESKEWSHKASIANNAVIGTMNQDGNIKSIALRHDVDSCIWNTEEMNPKCPMNHIATFDGIGYIHGKFIVFKVIGILPDPKLRSLYKIYLYLSW